MSDTDSAERRRPPTIDLTAQEVETERAADTNESAAASAASADGPARGGADARDAGRSPRWIVPYVFAGLIGAIGAAAVIAGLWLAGLAPPRGSASPQSAAGPTIAPPSRPNDRSEIEARLNKLRAAVQTRPPDAGPGPHSPDMSEMEARLNRLRAAVQTRPPDAGPGPHSPDMSEMEARLNKLRAAVQARPPDTGPGPRSADMSDMEARLDKLKRAAQAKPPDFGPASTHPTDAHPTDLETRIKALGDTVATLARRVDEIAASTHDLTVEAKAAAAAQEAKAVAQSKVQSGDLDQITQRVTALEGAVKTLSAEAARGQPSADDRAARAAVAAAALAAAVERGAPFRAELTSVTALGTDEHAIAALTPFADEGLQSAAALGRDLIKLLPALRQASATEPKESSLMARLEMNAQKLVRITRTDSAPTGNDPSSIIARIDMDARSGDLAGALTDIARLPPQTRAPADDWTKKAQAREAAVAASRRIAAEAVTALARPAQQ
jgi:hypothetical protein